MKVERTTTGGHDFMILLTAAEADDLRQEWDWVHKLVYPSTQRVFAPIIDAIKALQAEDSQ